MKEERWEVDLGGGGRVREEDLRMGMFTGPSSFSKTISSSRVSPVRRSEGKWEDIGGEKEGVGGGLNSNFVFGVELGSWGVVRAEAEVVVGRVVSENGSKTRVVALILHNRLSKISVPFPNPIFHSAPNQFPSASIGQ